MLLSLFWKFFFMHMCKPFPTSLKRTIITNYELVHMCKPFPHTNYELSSIYQDNVDMHRVPGTLATMHLKDKHSVNK